MTLYEHQTINQSVSSIFSYELSKLVEVDDGKTKMERCVLPDNTCVTPLAGCSVPFLLLLTHTDTQTAARDNSKRACQLQRFMSRTQTANVYFPSPWTT